MSGVNSHHPAVKHVMLTTNNEWLLKSSILETERSGLIDALDVLIAAPKTMGETLRGPRGSKNELAGPPMASDGHLWTSGPRAICGGASRRPVVRQIETFADTSPAGVTPELLC